MSELQPIKVAFIGAGAMAREHLRAFSGLPGVTLAGIHSRTRSRAEALAAEFGLGTVADSVAELYEKTAAAVVVIAVKELSLLAVCQAAFLRPWVVFMEKPPGYSLAVTGQLCQMAEQAGHLPLVGLNRRFIASTLAVQAGLAEHPQPRFIQVFDQENIAGARAAGQPEEVVQHWMFANAIHMVDYLRIFGRGRITGVRRVVPWDAQKPGVVVARVDFASGDLGLYQAIWDGPGPWAAAVTTPDMRYELRPLEAAFAQTLPARVLTPLPAHAWDREFKPGFRRQAEQVLARVRGQASGAVTLPAARETMELIHQIYFGP